MRYRPQVDRLHSEINRKASLLFQLLGSDPTPEQQEHISELTETIDVLSRMLERVPEDRRV